MKKKILVAGITGLSILLLTACTAPTQQPSNGSGSSLNQQTITQAPQWDLSKVNESTWGSTPKPSAQPKDSAKFKTQGLGAVVKDPKNITFNDQKALCSLSGTISYTDSYKQSRGDLYNSKDYLYNLVPITEDPIQNEKIESVNGTDYVTGTYTTPKDAGGNQYHQVAVRVFSTPLTIPNAQKTTENGPYNSDLSKGLPVAIIDYSCKDKKSITTSNWESGKKLYTLLFEDPKPSAQPTQKNTPDPNAPGIKPVTPSTPLPGGNVPTGAPIVTGEPLGPKNPADATPMPVPSASSSK